MQQIIKKHTGVYPLIQLDVDRANCDFTTTVDNIKVLKRDIHIDVSDPLQYTDVYMLSKDSQVRIFHTHPSVIYYKLYLFPVPVQDIKSAQSVWGFFYIPTDQDTP